MFTLLSPSKSITAKEPTLDIPKTPLLFDAESKALLKHLKSLSKGRLQKSLRISKPLAELNYLRFQQWESLPTKSAIWLYSGDVYNGLQAFTMTKADIEFAQKKIAIISGLYGLVRPLDGIKPYRLEMKLPLKGSWGNNLYDAWGQKIANYVMEHGEKTILMCASQEYSRTVTNAIPDNITLVTPRFLQKTDTGLKEKGLFAKYGRGSLARWVIDKRINSVNELQHFAGDGFAFNPELSSPNEIVYIVPKSFTLKGRFTKQ